MQYAEYLETDFAYEMGCIWQDLRTRLIGTPITPKTVEEIKITFSKFFYAVAKHFNNADGDWRDRVALVINHDGMGSINVYVKEMNVDGTTVSRDVTRPDLLYPILKGIDKYETRRPNSALN